MAHASLRYTNVDHLGLTPEGHELLVTRSNDLTVLRTTPTAARPLPAFTIPTPPGWERASITEGRAQWSDDRGTMWPGEPGIVLWLEAPQDSVDFRVVVSDRAEIDRPELSVDTWARLVLERLDDLPWKDDRIDLPHTLRGWVEDGERRFELHYTTQDGCEHYEVVRRVVERGEWLLRYELRTFENMPWQDAWTTLVETHEGAAPLRS